METTYQNQLRKRSAPGEADGRSAQSSSASRRRGLSIVEVMLVLVVMGVLLSLSAPSFRQSIEQSHADIAGANLRAIWTAQRVYWLEYRTYAAQLSLLESSGLLDPTIVSGSQRYTYTISSADNTTFTATANRVGSVRWTGQFTIDEDGLVAGVVQASGETNIVPGFY